jgi:prophage regulatory protein
MEESIPQLIPLPEVVKITGISKSEVFRRLKENRFPIPARLGTGRCTRWARSEIVDWVNARLAERGTKLA